jgi:hypothetical protein
MNDFSNLLSTALQRVTTDLDVPELKAPRPDTDLFALVDSLVIVNLLLESEMLLEQETGNYVPLADENLFDAAKSPLRNWSRWVAFVGERHGQ